MLLAQLAADTVAPLVQWIIGGSAALFMLNQAITFWKDHLREQPAPADTYATKREHDALAVEVEARFRELAEDRRRNVMQLHTKIDGLQLLVKDDVSSLHDRVTDLLAAFSELKGAVNRSLTK